MLKAHLRDKLGKVVTRLASQPGDPLLAWRAALAADEDTLTSSVMERLSYLSPGVTWKILSLACEPLTAGDAFPSLPVKDPTWHFWPSWDGADSFGPDVVIEFPDLALIFKARHGTAQDPAEWVSLIRAARNGPYRGRRLAFMALGGLTTPARQAAAQQVEELLGEQGRQQLALFSLPWERLPQALEAVRRSGHLHAGHMEVLKDLDAALADRGYRPRVPFSTLPSITAGARPSSSLDGWQPAIRQRPRAYGFATLEPTPLETESSSLLAWKVRS